MQNKNDNLRKIWTIEVSPTTLLTLTTVATTTAYFVYLVFAISVYDGNNTLPSMSWMIAYSRGTTITFTLLVFIHSYGVMAYLVIASEYIGIMSYQFRFITASSCIYCMSLVLVSYLPLDGSENPHNIFAVTSFVFAVFTVYSHKHTFISFDSDRHIPVLDFSRTTWSILISELSLILIISLLGIMFWFMDIVIAEYLFIGLLLVDKYIKVVILQNSGLLNVDGSTIEYTYLSPSNNNDNYAKLIRKDLEF